MNAKQAAFVAEYLVDLNAKQAAIRAGYSRRTAEVQGPRLLRNAQVKAAVDAGLAARTARLEVKRDELLAELLRFVRVDIGDAYDTKGDLKKLSKMSPDLRRAISGIKVTEHGTELKFWSKTTALELLGKHLGLWVDKVEHSGSIARPLKGKSADEILAALKGKP